MKTPNFTFEQETAILIKESAPKLKKELCDVVYKSDYTTIIENHLNDFLREVEKLRAKCK